MHNKIRFCWPVFYFCFMDYIEMDCRVSRGTDHTEILIAYLAAIGYTMFEETDYGVKAYIPLHDFSQEKLETIPFIKNPGKLKVDFDIKRPENKNWNEEWEKNFQPVIIGKEIYVRAEYHASEPGYRFELVIHPRMAFGTGHHATTSLVMQAMLELDFTGKRVLDMGCGTGILAILASKMGAASITAIDNDENAVENCLVNCEANKAGNIIVKCGDASTIAGETYDIILANINRNIILNDINHYAGAVVNNGFIVTSGYFTEDLQKIVAGASEYKLNLKKSGQLDNWCCAVFVKEVL